MEFSVLFTTIKHMQGPVVEEGGILGLIYAATVCATGLSESLPQYTVK